MSTRFTRIAPDTYAVSVDGEHIGDVRKLTKTHEQRNWMAKCGTGHMVTAVYWEMRPIGGEWDWEESTRAEAAKSLPIMAAQQERAQRREEYRATHTWTGMGWELNGEG